MSRRTDDGHGFMLALGFAFGFICAEGCEHFAQVADAQDGVTSAAENAAAAPAAELADSDSYALILGLAAEEGADVDDGHVALLWCFRERGGAVGISDAEEARRYCSALRGLPQSPWGRFLLSLESEAALRKVVPDVADLVDAWLDGKVLPNPCGERPWHFGGRRAATQRPNARVLRCGSARSTFFARPRRTHVARETRMHEAQR